MGSGSIAPLILKSFVLEVSEWLASVPGQFTSSRCRIDTDRTGLMGPIYTKCFEDDRNQLTKAEIET